jgi:hypothetical protein
VVEKVVVISVSALTAITIFSAGLSGSAPNGAPSGNQAASKYRLLALNPAISMGPSAIDFIESFPRNAGQSGPGLRVFGLMFVVVGVAGALDLSAITASPTA